MNSLQIEIAEMIQGGMQQVTLRQYAADILQLGFRLDRAMDCRCMARDMANGRTFPAITSCARQISTGAGFANTAADRTDPNWRKFMEYRKSHFAVVRNTIFTV